MELFESIKPLTIPIKLTLNLKFKILFKKSI